MFMSDNETPYPVPSVVKGTGYFTPMDMAPIAPPPEVPTKPVVLREMTGMPTAMHNVPVAAPPTDSSQAASESSNGASS